MDDPPSPQRENMLTIFLTGMAALFFLGFLILITGGFFFYLVQVVAAMTILGSLHYFLWGKLFSNEVADEREEEQLRQRAEAKEDSPRE